MPQTPITTEVHQPFDVHGNFRAEFTLNLVLAVDDLANIVDFSLGKIVGTGIGIDLELI